MPLCVSEVPIYGIIVEDFAWNAGLASGTFFDADFYLAVTTNEATVGAALGVNSLDQTQHYTDIEHGFLWQDGLVRIIELGQYVGPSATTYADTDLFHIMRIGTAIYYLRGYTYDYDVALYYDDRLPGIPLPGEIMWVSEAPSWYPVQVDTSIYSVNDTVCILYSGETWGLATRCTIAGEISYIGAAAAGITNMLLGELPFEGTIEGSAQEGVTAGEIAFEGFASSDVIAFVRGEIDFVGGAEGSIFVGPPEPGYLIGILEFVGAISGNESLPQGVQDGEINFIGVGTGSEFLDIAADDVLTGHISFEGGGVVSEGTTQANYAIFGHLPLVGFIVGTPGATEAEAACGGELNFVGALSGSQFTESNLIDHALDGEIEFEGYGIMSAHHINYFTITLPELGYGPPLLGEYVVEITDDIIATMQVQARLVSLVREFISIVTTPTTFLQQMVEVTDAALVVAQTIPDFSLYIADTFSIDSTTQVTQVAELAEQVLAAGLVQTFYQAVVAVISALYASDNKITGGSAEGATAGVSVQDFGPPSVEFTFTGYWKKGTEVQLGYTTDAGPGSISYTYDFAAQTGVEAMALFAVALDAQPLVNATFDGTSVTITAQSPATTVQL